MGVDEALYVRDDLNGTSSPFAAPTCIFVFDESDGSNSFNCSCFIRCGGVGVVVVVLLLLETDCSPDTDGV